MKVEIRFRGLVRSKALHGYILWRVEFQLSRFGEQLDSVVIRVMDVNGPRGGLDKRCQVTAEGPRIGFSTLAVQDTSLYSAVDSAVDRIARTIARNIERSHDKREGRYLRRAS